MAEGRPASNKVIPSSRPEKAHYSELRNRCGRWPSVRAVGSERVTMELSERFGSITPSRTAELTDAARALKAKGDDILELAAGEPDFRTPQGVTNEAIKALHEGYTGYAPNQGRRELREAICSKLWQENFVGYSPDEIVVTNGGKQAVAQAIMATCGPGDEVVIPAPHWVSYPEMARLTGATARVIQTRREDGYKITPSMLEAIVTERTKLLVLCSPSNPTGEVYGRHELASIAEVIRSQRRGMAVLSDEIYEHILHGDSEHVSIASLPGMQERTLLVNGFSKAFAMTGWRLGYVAAPSHVAEAINRIQSQLTSGASNFSQRAALAALSMGTGPGTPVAEMVSVFTERRDALIDRLRKIPRVRFNVPSGAFYLWLDASELVGPRVYGRDYGWVMDDEALCHYLLREAKVALVPGSAFGQGPALRVSYAASMDTLVRAADRLRDALDPGRLGPC